MTVDARPTVSLPEPPPGGFTIADLDDMDDFGHNVELINGGFVVSARPTKWHTRIMLNLWRTLADQTPGDIEITVEHGVRVENGTRPEPDLLAIRADPDDTDSSTYAASEVVLAVEIVSPSSQRHDRRTKPLLYAEAGIPHFWLIERDGKLPVLHTFELSASTGSYVATGIHHKSAKLEVPWPLRIDLEHLGR
jgi:Uma2 family endonuclease